MKLNEILADIKSGRKKKVVLDTDTFNEVDDQFALAYCYLSEKIDLLAVHAAPFHNERSECFADGMERSYKEIHKILKMTDAAYTTPVFRGSIERISDTRSYIESPACDNLIKVVRESDEIVYVLAIGAITNVASAIMKASDIRDKMCVVWLGAHEFDFGNISEFNLKQDLAASQYLINSGVPLLLCPACCVTYHLQANIAAIHDLYGYSELCDYLANIVEQCYIAEGKPENWMRIIWDIAAPAIIDIPDCAQIDIIKAPVFTDDYHYAFDSTRHEIMYLKKLQKEQIFKRTWDILKTVK